MLLNPKEKNYSYLDARSRDIMKKTIAFFEKRGKARRFGYNEKRELNALPRKLEKLEAEQSGLHDRMMAADYYKTAPEQIARDREMTDELIKQINACYDRWEELEALRDA